MSDIDLGTAKRYASALFDSVEPAQFDQFEEALKELAEHWAASQELRLAIQDPALAEADKLEALEQIAKLFNAESSFVNFVKLCFSNGRLGGIDSIAEQFSILISRYREAIELEVTSASEIADSEREQILNSLRSDFGPKLSVRWSVNPEILGGLLIRSGDTLLDGSLKGQLKKFRSQLLA